MKEYEIRDIALAPQGHQKIEWVRAHMPLLRGLEEEFTRTRPFEGVKISLSVHLEAKTAYLCKVLAAGGAQMSITGSKGGEPTRAGSALGDILGGLHVTIGILAAVNARTITGKGQRVDVSLMDSMIAATENTALKYIETGNIPAPMGNRYAAVSPYDSFTCKGGQVLIAAGNQKLYEKLCNEVLERPDMITDPRFVDMPGRLANQDAIAEVIEERIKDLTPNEAAELVLAHGIPAGPIMNIKEILDDEALDDPTCFQRIDAIVSAWHEAGLETDRHWECE